MADRFHLLRNLGDAVGNALNRHHGDIRAAAKAATALTSPDPVPVEPANPPVSIVLFKPQRRVRFAGFVGGLRRDLTAVRAALSLSWSAGPGEGQIFHLKTVNRTMCGRARFDLLRHRVLEAA
ncbi:hypothetical protein GGE65_007339 [Skermanella aerolata]